MYLVCVRIPMKVMQIKWQIDKHENYLPKHNHTITNKFE